MSAPISAFNFIFIGGILTAALAGSLHCVAMCGGLMIAATQNSRTYLYHLGRGLGYVLLGLGAGWVGQGLLTNSYMTWASALTGVLLVSVFAVTGIKMIRGEGRGVTTLRSNSGSEIQKFWRWVLSPIWSMPSHARALLVGLATPLLPCGFLYSFVLMAAATSSPARGMIVLFVFWLGTVPALVATATGLKMGSRFSSKHWGPQRLLQKSIGVLFVVFAIFLVTEKWRHFGMHGDRGVQLSNSAQFMPLICH